jgi:hypothetical protein
MSSRAPAVKKRPRKPSAALETGIFDCSVYIELEVTVTKPMKKRGME